MSHIAVIGATRGVGRLLVTLLIDQGDSVIATHRRPEQAEQLADAGASPVLVDLAKQLRVGEPGPLMNALHGADVVVYAAGSTSTDLDDGRTADREGPGLVAQAALAAGVHRFLLVTAFPEAWRDRGTPEWFDTFLRFKKHAEVSLIESDLDWTIVRPGTLTDDPGTGRVALGPAALEADVPRTDVAAVLAALVHKPQVRCEILEVTEGPVDIAGALDRIEQRRAR